MVNWKALGIGFIVTLILAFIGLFIPFITLPLAPLFGGIVVGYLAGGSYRNGIINGGLSTGIAGFIYSLVVLLLLGGVFSALITAAGLSVTSETITLIAILFAIIMSILYFIFGLIGGLVGVAISGMNKEKRVTKIESHRKSPKIPFTKENFTKCLCITCPVQEDSSCSKEKMLNIQEIMQDEEEPSIKPNDYPGMYCANGKAFCADIDTTKNCICTDCKIYKDYNLDKANPTFLYCKDGKAI